MKQKLIIILTFFFVLSIFVIKGNAMGIIKSRMKEVTGEIVSMDLAKNLLTIKTINGEMTFRLNEKTKIKIRKEEKRISDLKTGDKIKVYYTHVNGKDLAEIIMIKTVTKK